LSANEGGGKRILSHQPERERHWRFGVLFPTVLACTPWRSMDGSVVDHSHTILACWKRGDGRVMEQRTHFLQDTYTLLSLPIWHSSTPMMPCTAEALPPHQNSIRPSRTLNLSLNHPSRIGVQHRASCTCFSARKEFQLSPIHQIFGELLDKPKSLAPRSQDKSR
jgi:hypothetical protein